MNRGVLAGWILAVWLANYPAWAKPVAGAEDDNPELSSAAVTATPDALGDVAISVFLTGTRGHPDLGPLVRNSLQCDWHTDTRGPAFITGVCRHLLKSDGRSASGWLSLAPLAASLHRAGAADVQFDLQSSGHPLRTPGSQWHAQSFSLRRKRGVAIHASQFFFSNSAGELPPPFNVQMGTPWQSARLAVPFLLVFFGPALLAFWLRRRMARKQSLRSGVVWLNWILLASWLYWISAVNAGDLSAFTATVGIQSSLATLFIGAVVFCLPLQVAIASCVVALSAAPPGEVWRAVRQSLARESALLVPLALFLSGTGLIEQDWHVALFSWLAAFAAYQGITWLGWRWSFADLRILDVGDLRERAALIGSLAGVQLKNVYVLGSRIPREANAFALPGGNMILTRSLLDHCTRREVDSVMAHEIGHLVGRHIGLRSSMFWVYFLVLGPVAGVLVGKLGLPPAITAIPFAPLVYIILASHLSRRQEFNADARAIRLTNDPQGMIAALSRLACLTRLPVDWGGIQGSILSHPSMRNRVLALAKEFGVPESRALEILDNPEVLEDVPYTGPVAAAPESGDEPAPALEPQVLPNAEHYTVPAYVDDEQAAFTTSAKVSHAHWAAWVSNGSLLVVLVTVAYLARRLFGSSPWSIVAFPISLPFAACFCLWAQETWRRRFLSKMKRKIAARIGNSRDGVFVALLPGETVAPADGFYAWDLGFVFLDAERLAYCGEQARFSVNRGDIEAIEIRKGPLEWGRVHAVSIQTPAGSFNIHMADRGCSGRLARRLQCRLIAWRTGESAAPASNAAPEYPLPQLPELPRAAASRLGLAWLYAKKTVMLFAGALLLVAMLPMFEANPATAILPFAAPLIYMIFVFPGLIRRNT